MREFRIADEVMFEKERESSRVPAGFIRIRLLKIATVRFIMTLCFDGESGSL